MRAVLAELAILNLTEQVGEVEPEYMPIDEAWRVLDEEAALGKAPADLGRDVARWAAWVDHRYTRLTRIARGTANHRILRPATATGKFRPSQPGFAQVVLSIEPLPESVTITVDTSRCICPYVHQPSAEERASFLTAATEGIREMAARLRIVGLTVSILEIHVHPIDSNPPGFKYAASQAMKEAVRESGGEAI